MTKIDVKLALKCPNRLLAEGLGKLCFKRRTSDFERVLVESSTTIFDRYF